MHRLVDFSVNHSNLNASTVLKKKGKKRYKLHKNNNSNEFSLSPPPLLPRIVHGFDDVNLTITELDKLKEKIDKKAGHLQLLKQTVDNIKHLEEIRKYSASHHNSPILRNEINLLKDYGGSRIKLPVFKSNAYTKNNPKVVDSNPIVGYSANRVLSPERRSLNYGSLIFHKSFR